MNTEETRRYILIFALLYSPGALSVMKCDSTTVQYPLPERGNTLYINPQSPVGSPLTPLASSPLSTVYNGCKGRSDSDSEQYDGVEIYAKLVPVVPVHLADGIAAAYSSGDIAIRPDGLTWDGSGWLLNREGIIAARGRQIVATLNKSADVFNWQWVKTGTPLNGDKQVVTLMPDVLKIQYYDIDTDELLIVDNLYTTYAYGEFNIQGQSCSISNTFKSIGFKPVTAFSEIGSVTGLTSSPVNIMCYGSPKIIVTVTPGLIISESTNKLVSGNDFHEDGAEGIGIELLYNNNSIPKIDDIYTLPDFSEFISRDNVAYPLPLSVQYYQYALKVTEGSVKSHFIFNINYQ